MSGNTPFVGDVGTRIDVNVGIDADDILSAKLIVQKRNGTTEWIATPVTGTQTIRYITEEGDFDVAGVYQLQAYIETADWKGYGTVCKFIVNAHL